MAVVLLLSGGLEGLRTVSIIAAFPFMILMVLMAFALHRDLTQEFWQREEKERLIRQRIESMLMRESEREAEREAAEEVHPTAPDTVLEPEAPPSATIGQRMQPPEPEEAAKPKSE